MISKYGLSKKVIFCKKCTMSNQRPVSAVEFKNNKQKKIGLFIDKNGICDACKYSSLKKNINWDLRHKQLIELFKKYRRTDGRYDVLIPGSGGKDSVVAANIIKYKYKMNPLLVTWPPTIATSAGRKNFNAWLENGFANYSYYPNKKLHKILTKLAFVNLCHPFQPFMIGQKNLPPKLAHLLDIPLIFYGENEAEYGNSISNNKNPQRDKKYFVSDDNIENIFLGGVNIKSLIKDYKFRLSDFEPYIPIDNEILNNSKIQVHYLGYYMKWHPQEIYYYSAEKTKFKPNTFRTEGSYSRYSSIDDKIDWLHFYTLYIKYGLGRASYDTAQEIRNGDITRDEGIRLVKRFDSEFPSTYINDCMNYMEITRNEFDEVIEKARSSHLWKKNKGIWELRKPIWKYD